jgi:hypothetical protein
VVGDRKRPLERPRDGSIRDGRPDLLQYCKQGLPRFYNPSEACSCSLAAAPLVAPLSKARTQMGTVAEVFRWHYIHGGQKAGVTVSTYFPEESPEYVGFSIIVTFERNRPPGVNTPALAQLTEGLTWGGTSPPPPGYSFGAAHDLWVENQTAGPHSFITVRLMRFRQSVYG